MSKTIIKRLDVAGFKSIASATLNFGQITVLIGANGAGKLNLFSFLSMVRWLANHDLEGFVFKSGGANALLRFGANQTPEIRFRLAAEGNSGEPSAYAATLTYGIPDSLLISSETLLNGNGQPVPQGMRRESVYASRTNIPACAVWESLKGLRIHHFHNTTNEAQIRQNCDINDDLTLHEDGGNLAAILYRLQETDAETVGRIEATVEQAAPFFNGFQLAPLTTDKTRIHLRWNEHGHGESFNVHYLSDGTLRFIALATVLLQSDVDLPPVLILDEPELGLHPYAITLLASMIHHAANYRQVIVATQSKELLDHFDPKDVVVVERRERATEFRRLNATDLAEWLEEFTLGELWDKNVFGGRPGPWHG